MIPYAHSFDCDCQSLSFDSWVGYLVTPHLHWNHNYHPRHHPRRTLIHFLLSGCSQNKPFWVGLSTHDMNTNTTSAAISFNTTLLKRSHTTPSEKKRMCLRTAIWLCKVKLIICVRIGALMFNNALTHAQEVIWTLNRIAIEEGDITANILHDWRI